MSAKMKKDDALLKDIMKASLYLDDTLRAVEVPFDKVQLWIVKKLKAKLGKKVEELSRKDHLQVFFRLDSKEIELFAADESHHNGSFFDEIRERVPADSAAIKIAHEAVVEQLRKKLLKQVFDEEAEERARARANEVERRLQDVIGIRVTDTGRAS